MARGRGRDPIKPVNLDENPRGHVQSIGRGRGRAVGRPRAIFLIQFNLMMVIYVIIINAYRMLVRKVCLIIN